MLKVGITGQSGFIGTHLFNTLNLFPDKFKLIPFGDELFNNINKLKMFVRDCDVIVHLAAMNRHNDPRVIYETNLGLVNKLINACGESNSKPHILFSSSIQEERDNPYGKSKKEGRLLLEKWALSHNAMFTGLIIPNVFGPFGNPYYNSVVATFSHQLTHNEQPGIDMDGEMKLIYVGELVSEIINRIEAVYKDKRSGTFAETVILPHTAAIKVSGLLEKLNGYKENYIGSGIIPDLSDPFDRNLFNTFLCYADHSSLFPFLFKQNKDNRGSFVEILKSNSRGQFSFSTTRSGITRGNHFHTRKAERFAVIKGKARIEIRRIGTDKILSFELDGENPSFVDMPVWFTHNITNTGKDDLYTLLWINEFYDPNDCDTFFENV
jgi:UDP-2-acetamido-2,6-beta-L-arabino-hexul-4-ose reductase